MMQQQRETSVGRQPIDGAMLESAIQATQNQLMQRPELMQMRMENESIMAECRVRPRNLEEIRRVLTDQLQAFPELAEDAIYSKPVGKEEGSDRQKFARGLSIRAAEVMAEAYGYNRVRSDVTPLDVESSKVKVEATFTDFQNGRIWQDGGIVSAYYRDRRGRMQKIPEDRLFNVVCKAEASKRVREVILRSVNAALKAWFFAECERRMDALLDDAKVNQIVAGYAQIGVTVEQLETLIGRPRSMGWTNQDRSTLASLWNAIKDGETKVDEAFPRETEPRPTEIANGKSPTSSKVSPHQPPKLEGIPKVNTTDGTEKANAPSENSEPGVSDALAEANDRFTACTDLASVNATQREMEAVDESDSWRANIASMADEARDRIRATRGSRANGR